MKASSQLMKASRIKLAMSGHGAHQSILKSMTRERIAHHEIRGVKSRCTNTLASARLLFKIASTGITATTSRSVWHPVRLRWRHIPLREEVQLSPKAPRGHRGKLSRTRCLRHFTKADVAASGLAAFFLIQNIEKVSFPKVRNGLVPSHRQHKHGNI